MANRYCPHHGLLRMVDFTGKHRALCAICAQPLERDLTAVVLAFLVVSTFLCIFTARVLWARDAGARDTVLDRVIPESLLSGNKHRGKRGEDSTGMADRRGRVPALQVGDDLLH
jgi:hypothetical protein